MPLWGRSRQPEPASDEIVEYLQLLDDGAPEEKVQQFLEEHLLFWSEFMRDDTPCPLYAKTRLGSEYVADFAFFDPSSDGPEWFLVEIERPGVGPMFLKNGDPSSKLMHAIHQVESWQEWIMANLPYAQQLMPQIDRPMGLVFFGRRSELQTREARARLRALNHRNRDHFQVRTLDSFIDGARAGRAPSCIPPRALSHDDLRKGLPPDAKEFLEGLFGRLRHFEDRRYGLSHSPVEPEENTLELEAGGEAIVRAAWQQQGEEGHQRRLRQADQAGRMELIYDDMVVYSDQHKPGLAFGGTFSSFRLRLYEGYRRRPVAIATQLPFEGQSLMNNAVKLCQAVWIDFFPTYREPPICVQHYPDLDDWDFVEFKVTADRRLGSPRWRPASQQEVEAIVGQPVSPHRSDFYRPRCEYQAFEDTEE